MTKNKKHARISYNVAERAYVIEIYDEVSSSWDLDKSFQIQVTDKLPSAVSEEIIWELNKLYQLGFIVEWNM